MSTWQTSPVTFEPEIMRTRQVGLSLVELMVATVIGMLTMLAIIQTVSFFEAQRRGVTTGADSQSSGAFAAYLVERDLRMAGYGVFSDEANLIQFCSNGIVRAYNSTRTPPEFQFSSNSVPFVPVSINSPGIPAGDAGTDVVGVSFSDSNIGVSGKAVRIGIDTGSGVTVQNAAGFVTGDTILLVPAAAGRDCSVYEITDGPGVVNCSGSSSVTTLEHGTANYASRHRECATVAPTRNQNGGLGVTYQPNSSVFNLGRGDRLTQAFYAVRGGRLTRCDYYQADCGDAAKINDPAVWVPMADGIVILRAELGIADAGGTVTIWRTTVCSGTGCTPTVAEWQSVRLIRIAVVARSQQPGGANTTTSAPVWNGQTPITLTGDWQQYRYGITEVVVPMRNIIWGASS